MYMNTMSKSYISAILSDENWKQGDFRINSYDGTLQYKIESDLIDTIDNRGDDRHASTCSDLSNLLKLRNYNLLDSKGIDPMSGELGFISSYDEDGCASKIEVISDAISIKDIESISSLQSELLNMQIGYIPNTYIDNGTGDYSSPERYGLTENYFNFRLVKDLISKSTVLNVLALSGVTYTDTLDLSRILSDLPDTSSDVSIRLGIKYSRDGDEIIKLKEMIFSSSEDTQYDINGEVTMEYFNKCIRLFSISSVNECIIDYCHIICNYE